ncbi:N-formylglutamate amidohydrolase [Phenylobacterium sp.]|uniref:N-formylglutamate amidohydrolase n=1 Tax=Phenylobacterium sp. TaxID=1871053 RepID=UPI00272F561E|nr:N-formylglutamate amidohydrolase [Phenylobacterium sp.]MDP1874369.1 N-formylglutamate amidohydrolase [Phenylobacterium sp.]MDP3490400.1 N-formylglutamate amidohydrolase [Phenylobacterium sp.]
MSAVEPLDVAEPATLAPAGFLVRRAASLGAPPPTPVIFASPHSGRLYPDDMMSATTLDAQAIRRSEDAFVDQLVEDAPQAGAALIIANYARAYIDVNRDAFELDPGMFVDELPDFARSRTARVAAGLGAIAKVVSEGQEIYARKLTFAEAQGRIDGAHRPYHAALSQLIAEAQAAHGIAILVDWHSMPSAAARAAGAGGCDMVLGDRFGAACANSLTRLAEVELEARGYRVVRNTPYAGGYTTEHYGRPARRVHALQIELNRALYLDEETLSPTADFARLKADIATLTAALTAQDWSRRL